MPLPPRGPVSRDEVADRDRRDPPRVVRPRGRRPRPLVPRPRPGRGVGAGRLRDRARPLAARRHPRRAGRVDRPHRPQPRDRRDPAPARRRRPRALGGRVGPAGRSSRSRRARRRAARPAVRLLPSGAGGGGPRGADAAHRRGPDRRGDRPRLPDRARHGRPAAGAGEAARPRGRDPAARSSSGAAAGAARRRARDGVPALQRGLRRDGRARSDARRAVRRGDPPRAAAGAADAGRGRGARVCSRC